MGWCREVASKSGLGLAQNRHQIHGNTYTSQPCHGQNLQGPVAQRQLVGGAAGTAVNIRRIPKNRNRERHHGHLIPHGGGTSGLAGHLETP